jgi:hypothetical protein
MKIMLLRSKSNLFRHVHSIKLKIKFYLWSLIKVIFFRQREDITEGILILRKWDFEKWTSALQVLRQRVSIHLASLLCLEGVPGHLYIRLVSWDRRSLCLYVSLMYMHGSWRCCLYSVHFNILLQAGRFSGVLSTSPLLGLKKIPAVSMWPLFLQVEGVWSVLSM